MKRYSTLTHVFSSNIDLSQAQIYVTYSQDGRVVIEKTGADVVIGDDGKTFTVILGQADTSRLHEGEASVQFRYLFRDGESNASDRWKIIVEDIDKKEVLEWR